MDEDWAEKQGSRASPVEEIGIPGLKIETWGTQICCSPCRSVAVYPLATPKRRFTSVQLTTFHQAAR
jgi:hypothetical protein